ncbi:hypothetical protein CISIN_1g041221mg [Citrus sinensis]|uniref:Uncharacterized protein n=1 Tax=Citrus sinensis TaxID=2711 RepID=A0A067DGR4_CITSI|nr:hypothetical protein CISIN_1g041221mg [Citrus sinensis]
MGNLKVKTTSLRQSRPAVERSISRCLFLVTGFNRLNQFNFITYVFTWQAFIDQPIFSLIVCSNKQSSLRFSDIGEMSKDVTRNPTNSGAGDGNGKVRKKLLETLEQQDLLEVLSEGFCKQCACLLETRIFNLIHGIMN